MARLARLVSACLLVLATSATPGTPAEDEGLAQLLGRAVDAAREHADAAAGPQRDNLLAYLALAEARLARPRAAVDLLAAIADTARRRQAGASVAAAHARRGDVTAAERLLGTVGEGYGRSRVLRALAPAYARRGDAAAARRALAALTEAGYETARVGAATELALVAVRRGDIRAAYRVIRELPREDAWLALLAVARDYARRGDVAAAEETLRAVPVARLGKRSEIIEYKAELAAALAEAGEMSRAREVVGFMRLSKRYYGQHVWALGRIAAAEARAGREEAARALFAEALAEADGSRGVTNPWALSQIAAGQAQAGLIRDALKTLARFDADARADADELALMAGQRALAANAVAVALARSGQSERAAALFARARRAVDGMAEGRRREQVRTLARMARAQAEAGLAERARATMDEALARAEAAFARQAPGRYAQLLADLAGLAA